MENITKVHWKNFIRFIHFFLFSYRLKPDLYGVNSLFGIDLAPTDTQKDATGLIHVRDTVQVLRDDPDFWKTK